jgi:beta-galactosidase
VAWSVNYAPGTLQAVAYKNGAVWGTDTVSTAGSPAAMVMQSPFSTLTADGESISPIAVTIVDAQGITCPTANNSVVFSVTGPGQIVGVGNGNPSNNQPENASQRSAFNGKCMVLVRHTSGYGTIVVTATSTGLTSATCSITVPSPSAAIP